MQLKRSLFCTHVQIWDDYLQLVRLVPNFGTTIVLTQKGLEFIRAELLPHALVCEKLQEALGYKPAIAVSREANIKAKATATATTATAAIGAKIGSVIT